MNKGEEITILIPYTVRDHWWWWGGGSGRMIVDSIIPTNLTTLVSLLHGIRDSDEAELPVKPV